MKEINLHEMDRNHKVHEVQLELLDVIKNVCEENDLSYQIFAGTLLGSIRHKGFIPWDDDIDVAMPRKDYELLLKIFADRSSTKYFLQTIYTDKNSPFLFAKLRKRGTRFVEESTSHIEMDHGIFIDIFPLDSVNYDDYQKANFRILRIVYTFQYIFSINKELLSKRTKVLRTVLDPFVQGRFHHKLKTLIDKKLKTLNQNDTEKYYNHLTNSISQKRFYRYIIDKNKFHDLEEYEFEGNFYSGPKDYDHYLTSIYGDYMKLPPIEEQKSHHGIISIDFESSNEISNMDILKEKVGENEKI